MDFSVERAESRGIDLYRLQSQGFADLLGRGCANEIIAAEIRQYSSDIISHCAKIHEKSVITVVKYEY
jgi:hypothetical protein